MEAAVSNCVRLGAFELDLKAGELRTGDRKVRLQEQPFQILLMLVERSGGLVTREEIEKRLWPNDTVVEFDHSIHTAINKLRQAFGDSAENPKYIETVARRGYRLMVPAERVVASPGFTTAAPPEPAEPEKKSSPSLRLTRKIFAISCGLVLVLGAGWLVYHEWHSSKPAQPVQRALTRLTFDDGLQIGATWSPDGRYIAYSSDRGGKFDIWVQQVSGGDPIQITRGSGHHWQPDWSPDGRYIAYRSEEGDGGIYIIPVLGGVERKIAPFGYHPRWSPDSSEVLIQSTFLYRELKHFYLAQLDASPPREVLAEFIAQTKMSPASATWYPDGKRITICVGDYSPVPSFWTVPIAGGPGAKLEIAPMVERELEHVSGGFGGGNWLLDYAFSWSPSGDALYFERGYRGAKNIWKITVDPEVPRATAIERLTTGSGPDTELAVSPDGKRLAFTAKSQRVQTWLYPFDSKTGQLKGAGKAITSAGTPSVDPNLSWDGTKVATVVGRAGGFGYGIAQNEVWIKSLSDGSEAPIFSDDYSRWIARWSPDDIQLVYRRTNERTDVEQLVLWSSQSREEEPLTGVTKTAICDWSRDGKWLLAAEPDGVWLVPFPSSPHAQTVAQKIASNAAYQFYQSRISPDDRWIVFEAVSNAPIPESSLYVVSASGGPWSRITDGRHWDDKPRWSPDGRTIYFVSGPGGFFNIWGIRFDPAGGKPIGQPFQVSKFNSPRLMIPRNIPPVGLSLTQDKLVLTMSQESGNIWILDNVDR